MCVLYPLRQVLLPREFLFWSVIQLSLTCQLIGAAVKTMNSHEHLSLSVKADMSV